MSRIDSRNRLLPKTHACRCQQMRHYGGERRANRLPPPFRPDNAGWLIRRDPPGKPRLKSGDLWRGPRVRKDRLLREDDLDAPVLRLAYARCRLHARIVHAATGATLHNPIGPPIVPSMPLPVAPQTFGGTLWMAANGSSATRRSRVFATTSVRQSRSTSITGIWRRRSPPLPTLPLPGSRSRMVPAERIAAPGSAPTRATTPKTWWPA
jgi:hypothetical protein